MGDGRFEPHRSLKRSEAAKILTETAKLLGVQGAGGQYPFTDRDSFGWATEFIDFCGVNGIMNGVSGGGFGPNGTFSREQAVVTILRIQQRYGK